MTLGQIWYIATILTQINICAINFVCESDTIRGWPFDSEGGGDAGKFGQDRLFNYLRHELGRKIYFQVLPRLEYLFSSATKFGKKQKTNKQNGGGVAREGGVECWFRRRLDRIFHVFFLFLQTTGICAYSVCKWSSCMLDFHLVMYKVYY